MRSESGFYLGRLDHLRFFAASLIVFYHTFHRTVALDVHYANPLLLFVDEGHTAVSFFLVISGFIFATLARGSAVLYGPFIYNRIARIYPLLVVAVMFGASLQRSDVTALGMLFDYLTPLSSFKTAGPTLGLFPHLWSVIVEMQVYLIFPFIHRFGREYGLRYLLGLASLMLLLRALAWLAGDSAQTVAYWTIFGRLDQFVVGMLLAHVSAGNPARFRNPLWLLGALALAYATMLWLDRLGGFYGNSPHSIWVVRPTLEAIAWGAIVVTYLQSRLTPGRLLSQLLNRLGEVSYSIYVMHIVVLASSWTYVARLAFSDNPPWNAFLQAALVILPLTCAVSFVTYRLVERPFLRMRRHYLIPDYLPPSAVPAARPAPVKTEERIAAR